MDQPSSSARRLLQPRVLIPVAVVGVAVVTFGLLYFAPWRLLTSTTVDEALPGAVAAATEQPLPPAPAETTKSGRPTVEPTSEPSAAPTEPAGPTTLESGSFISHEHDTAGKALIIELPDGSKVLRLEGLDTSDGPDLKVWLTDAPVIEGNAGWHVFDDGQYVDLGGLKGNKGNQNYPLPGDVNLKKLTSVSIWCDRFDVSFGAAELTSA
jgi:hypothetical protein